MKLKVIIGSVLASTLMVAAAPAYSGNAMQVWKCEIEEGTTEKEIKDFASKWLAGAKKLDGGKDLQASVIFPVAVNAMGETDMMFTVVAPNFADWGKFWDAYGDSELAVMDGKNDKIDCPNSAVWESFSVK